MSIDCTCTLGTRSDGWGEDTSEAILSMPVYDGLIDPFCPIHGEPDAVRDEAGQGAE